MKMSHLLAPTLREVPAEAEIISHQLLVRAGFIRRVSPGVYNYYPLMWRVVKKVEAIVREGMDNAGSQELLMPILLPAELWQSSGRWYAYGKEMFRLKNRHDREELLGPTHEEAITDIAKNELRSYRQLPACLYQIQNKFRDEIRPRFGLLRGREFIMKDAYSFHVDEKSLEETYEVMCDAYTSVFERCGLKTRKVESDVGAIGGSSAHEFMVVVETDAGESTLLYCDKCDYAANIERAESLLMKIDVEVPEALKKVPTPGVGSIEDLTAFLKVPASKIVKTMVYACQGFGDDPEKTEYVAVLIRGDLAVNEVKLQNKVGSMEIRLATNEEVENVAQTIPGFVGPKGLKIRVLADESVRELTNFVMGPNEADMHYINANWDRDYTPKEWVNVRLAQLGDTCPHCQEGKLKQARGIEVGNTFKLGTKYSSKMNATYTDVDGSEKPFVMGCYGIGVTRTAQAAVEACHDENGIIWPMAIAPYHLIVVPVSMKDEEQAKVAEDLYHQAQKAGIEVLFDDRDERPGVKFKDADLIGIPLRLVVGKGIKEGQLELKIRATGEAKNVSINEAIDVVKKLIQESK